MNAQSNQAPKSDNLTTGQLSEMLATQRQNSSQTDAGSETPPASEHTAGAASEAEPDLSQSAPNSPDLEAGELGSEGEGEPSGESPETNAEGPPDPETPETPTPEAEEGHEHEVAPKTVEQFQKRLQSKNRKIEALHAELATLKAQQETPEAARPEGNTEPPGGTLEAHPAVRAAHANLTEAKSLLQWAKLNPSGGEFEGRSGKIAVSPEQAEAILENGIVGIAQLSSRLENVRNEAGHALRAERDARAGEARQRYPNLFNSKSPEYQEAAKITAAMPWLSNMPGVELILGRYMAGMRAEQAAAKARTGSAVPRRNPAPVVAQAANVAPKPETGQDKLKADYQAAKVQYEKSGSTQDRSRLLALQRQLSTAG